MQQELAFVQSAFAGYQQPYIDYCAAMGYDTPEAQLSADSGSSKCQTWSVLMRSHSPSTAAV